MSDNQRMHHRQILNGRYCEILKGLPIDLLAKYLLETNLLTPQEQTDVTMVTPESPKRRELARILTLRQVDSFSDICSHIKKFKAGCVIGVASGVNTGAFRLAGPAVAPANRSDVRPVEAFSVLFFALISQLKISLKLPYHQNIPKLDRINDEPQTLTWLYDDVPLDSVQDYFIHNSSVKGMALSSPQPIRLSILLEAFQQVASKFLDLSEQKRSLEVKLSQQFAARVQPSGDKQKGSVVGERMAGGQLKNFEDMETLYRKSEERCKQLVVVTQQWAIECEDKNKVISLLESELQQVRTQLDSESNRVAKYKQYWQDNRSSRNVSDGQLEELRVELSQRRALYDQVIEAKYRSEQKVKDLSDDNAALNKKVEELKDHLVELRDNYGNLKFQASVKEPAVREMSALLSELRDCKNENVTLKREKLEMEDEIMALKMALTDDQADLPQVKEHWPTKTEAMVTGFHSAKKPSQPMFYEVQKGVFVRLANHSGKVRRLSSKEAEEADDGKDDDSISESSDDTLPSLLEGSVSSSTRDTYNRRDVKHQGEKKFQGVVLPEGDYTRGTRYPNYSGVLVSPLDVGEISLNDASVMRGGNAQPQQHGKNPVELSKACGQGAFNDFERKCPVCEHVFLTLGELEFQSHVAMCFR